MMEDIINLITDTILTELKGNISIAVQITVIALICAVFKGMETEGIGKEVRRAAFLVEYSLVTALLCTSLISIKDTASGAIDRMVGTMNGVTPVLLTAAATFGSFASVSGIGSSLIIANEIVSNLLKMIFLPAGVILAVLYMTDSFSDKVRISNLVNLLKTTLLWGLGIVMTLYLAVLSIQSLVTRTTEGAINKTVKFAAGSMIPFVGQYLSESLNAVSASAAAINSAAGTGAMITIITMAIGPALKILITAGMLKLAAAIIQPVTDERISKCIADTATAFSLIAGLTAVCAVIFTITIGVLLDTVSAAAGR